jgi:hypothetical protein
MSKKLLHCLKTIEEKSRIRGSGSIIQWYGSANPDPYQNVTVQMGNTGSYGMVMYVHNVIMKVKRYKYAVTIPVQLH